VKGEGTKLLLDYGILVRDGRPSLPLSTSPKDLNGIIITHAHLDHSGAAPFFYISESPPVYMTSVTKQLTDILIRDLIRLSSYYLPFETLELKTMIEESKEIRSDTQLGNAHVSFASSGHIPGSVNVLVEQERKAVWYSGDINTIDTALLERAQYNLPELDMAIVESTYATVDHPPREECERRLVETVTEVVEGGGLALIPAFSVGRSQEILCILQKHGFKHDVALDGMSRTATQTILNSPEELRDAGLLRKAADKAKWVKGERDRKKVLKKPGVVISSSGLLTGGASTYYMETIKNRSKDAVVLVSFQIPGTPGRTLLDQGMYGVPGELRKVKCRVEWINFSSHADRGGLMRLVKSMKGTPKILCVHGEAACCQGFADAIRSEIGFEAYAPNLGDCFTL